MRHATIGALIGLMILSLLTGCGKAASPSEVPENKTETPPPDSKQIEVFQYVYKHRDTAAGGNDREAYIWEVMKAALEATVTDYGPYEIQPVADINQEREDYELIQDTGLITVISDSLNQNNLDNLAVLKFPVMRDLLGYRVFLIDKNRAAEFKKIKTAEDLKAYAFGIGIGWNDKIILEHAGLKVYEEREYKLLFKDVSTGVIDIFSRGINEVVGEYDNYSKQYDNLAIEEQILLYYPLPRYFWFSKSERGEQLKERLEVGLKRINENGTLDVIFERYFKESLSRLNLKQRTLIRLENPVYTKEFETNDAPYIFDPLK